MDSLALNIAVPVGAAALENYIIYGTGTRLSDTKANPMLPPGYIIGIVWMVLLGLLGYAHFLLYTFQGANNIAASSVIVLILYCLAYPIFLYYKAFTMKELNIFSVCITAVAFTITYLTLPKASYAVLPTLLWVSYVVLSDVIYP